VSFHPVILPEERHRSQRTLVREGEPFTFTPENRAALEAICQRYPPERRRSAILPALYLVQEQQRFITAAAMRHVAEVIGCSTAEVEDVVSFYTMFFTKPVGQYVLQVCRTLSCALRGAERVTERLSTALNIAVGETDAAGEFTLLEVECLGACDRAPVVMINNEYWQEHLHPDAVDAFLDRVRVYGMAAISGCHLQDRPTGGNGDRHG